MKITIQEQDRVVVIDDPNAVDLNTVVPLFESALWALGYRLKGELIIEEDE